jgi:16S rRNA (adenine1518-N6/adenine1519-N6)-dimethyltransferase
LSTRVVYSNLNKIAMFCFVKTNGFEQPYLKVAVRYNIDMDITDVDDLKFALRLAGLKARKGLGQHFLIDRESLALVMGGGELLNTDTVVEVGPGLGVMTLPLTRQVKEVVAVEADHRLAELLRRDKPDNLEIVEADILEFDLSTLPTGYKVVANIPYYLTSQLIRLLLENPHPPKLVSLLIQREVAQRIVAEPGNMSVLALSVQYYGAAQLLGVVERHKFWPAPKVDSAVLQVKLYDQPAFPADRQRLFRLIKAGFGEKRKMMKNSLAGGLNLSTDLAVGLIAEAGLPPQSRAQELELEQWEPLYRAAVAKNYI